jgi:hypothetical protein
MKNATPIYWVRMMLTLSAISVFFLASPGESTAATKADSRVENALKKVDYKYAVTPLGNFRVSFKLDDGRGHLVFISSSTETFGSLEIRKIWATVMKSKEPLPRDLANKLLMDNIPMKLGAYELTQVDKGGYKIQFSARVDARCTPAALMDAVRIVLMTADGKEKELTNADEF